MRHLLLRIAPIAFLLCGCSRPQASVETARRQLELGRYKESEQTARELLRRLGAPVDSLHVADVLDVLVGALERQQVKGEEPRNLARQVIGIRERRGPADPALAASLRNLGRLHANRGEFSDAIAVFERAVALLDRAAGARTPLVAPYYTELAIVLSLEGKYDGAISLYEQALELFEASSPADELEMAVALNGLGMVRYEIGDFARSRDCHERALGIRKRLLAENPNHPKVAESRNNLGILLLEMRDYAPALQHFEAVVAVRTQVYGENHRLVGRGLNNAAIAEQHLGRPQQARQTAQRALAILEPGDDLVSTAAALGTLGAVHRALREYERAGACFERARQIRAAHQPSYLVVTLEDLARLHHETGHPDVALGLATHALVLCESLLSVEHPLVARYEALRATLFAELQQGDAAVASATRAEEVRAAHLRLTSQAVSDREALLFSGSEERGLDVLLHLATDPASSSPALRRQAWEALIRSRAIVLDVMVARSRAMALAADPATARLLDELRQKSNRYANLAARGASGDRERYDQSLNELREAKERIEGELARRGRTFQESERADIGLDQIALHLPRGSALVAYATLAQIDRAAGKQAGGGGRDIVALVLRPEDSAPRLVSLGDAGGIDTLIAAWNYEAARGVTDTWRTIAESEAACRQAGEALRAAIWDPVAAYVPDSTLVLVVPEAALFRVSLAALPRSDGTYLAESGLRFHYLASERDVVPAANDSVGTGLLALGGAVFDRTAGGGTRGRRDEARCGGLDGIEFRPLPGTLQEVEEIASQWSAEAGAGANAEVVFLTGATATDSAFAVNASRKRRLHLATHGFFVDARCAVPDAPGDDPSSNPLQLSGLAFSRPDGKHDSTNDGFLIAEEIAALDLHGVECAVLSACETGVGNVVTGEGILGLRRAFQVAGVRTVIMSLWAVSDEPTRDWMRALYSAQLQQRLGTVTAVQQAYLRSLEARRKRQASCAPCEACSTHPFFWASFVAAGEWR